MKEKTIQWSLSILSWLRTFICFRRQPFAFHFIIFPLQPGEKTFNAGNGEITTSITDFSMKLDETGEWDWQGKINDLLAKDFVLDGIGKKCRQARDKLSKIK
ncbi:MAG: hypothetical protein WDO71_21045 [Bacteroidota bacterium]